MPQDKSQSKPPSKVQNKIDAESYAFYSKMGAAEHQIRAHHLEGIKTALIVLSAAGVVFDRESLRQKVSLAYPDAAVFFIGTDGKAIGAPAPQKVDLLIDFSGPGQRQNFLFARKMRKRARIAFGRNAGFFRKRLYNQVIDEKSGGLSLPKESLEREALVQTKVMELAGVALVPSGDTPPDRGKITPLGLAPLRKL